MKIILTKIAYIATLIVVLIAVIAAFIFGRMSMSKPSQSIEITKEVILDKIVDQNFLVTKTLFLDEEVTISVVSGSEWKDFLWGKVVNAEGLVRVDVGVDLESLSTEDIQIDNINKKIKITLPEAKILDASVYGDIKIQTEKGVFKSVEEFIDTKENEDYNNAVNELINTAKSTVDADTQMKAEAKKNSQRLIQLIVNDLGYSLSE